MKLLTILVACLAVSCANKAPPRALPVPAALVTVTDTKPIVQAVERQTERLEIRVNDTSKKVAEIAASANAAVETAIRSGDVKQTVQAKTFQAQVGELKALTDVATATAKDLQEDSKVAHAELSKASAERDSALIARETIRVQMLADRSDHVASINRLDERRIGEAARADWWKKRALFTWGGLAALGSIFVGLKLLKPF